jgi:hypothetical protein
MAARRIFQLTLVVVLWYLLTGLICSRVLGVWPEGFEREGYFITAAAVPWSLLALDFYQPTDSPIGAVVRDLLFFALIAGGIAVNAVIVGGMLRGVLKVLDLDRRIRRIERERGRSTTARKVSLR